MHALPKILAVTVLSAVDAAAVWSVPHVGDWYQFWYAGHIVATGGSPYDATAWDGALRQPLVVGSATNIVRLNCEGPEPAACLWRYPPWTALVYAPFGALPPDLGITLLSLATIVAAVTAVVLLLRHYARADAAPMLAVAVALTAQPLIIATRTGHLDALLLVGATLVILGLQGRLGALVAGSIVLSLKPHLFIAFAAIVAIALARDRRWRDLGVTGASIAALALVTSLLYPPPLSRLLSDTGTRVSFDVPTLWALQLTHAIGWPLVIGLVAMTLASAALAFAWSDRGDDVLVAVALAVSLALAPYEQSYDHALLLPAVLLALSAATSLPRGRPRAAAQSLVVAVGVGYPWWAYVEDVLMRSQTASSLVPVLTLAALATVHAVRRASETAPVITAATTP